ncbi:MAG: Dabb family protein [Bacteroidales bacterium]|nr:Dabb family protein [Bacteroidales bacterium]
MIKHIVLIRLKQTDRQEIKEKNADKLKALLESLVSIIPEIKHLEVGKNSGTRNAAYDLALVTEFNNTADLDIYRNHPEHIKVLNFLKEITHDTAVVDYEF